MASYSGLLILTYITIATNFLNDMFPCNLKQILQTNRYAKHLVIFMAILFFVTADKAADKAADKSFRQYIMKTFYIYGLYVLSCKCLGVLLIPALCMLFADQLIEAYIQRHPEDNSKLVLCTRTVLTRTSVAMIVLGAFMYFTTNKLTDTFNIQCIK